MRRIGSVLALVVVAALGLVPAAGAAPAPAAGRSWEVVTGLSQPLRDGERQGDHGALAFIAVDDRSVRQTAASDYLAHNVAYSPDARTLYSAGTIAVDPEAPWEGQIGAFRAFDASTGELLWEVTDTPFGALAVSSDGSVAMVSGGESEARVDLVTKAVDPLDVCPAVDQPASSVAFAPDGRTVWFVCTFWYDEGLTELRAYDSVTLDLIGTIPLPEHFNVYGPALTPDGSAVVVAGRAMRDERLQGVVTRVDLSTGEFTDLPFETDGARWGSVEVSPDGSRAFVARYLHGDFEGELYAVDIASMSLIESVTLSNYGGDVAVMPDGTRVFAVALRWTDGPRFTVPWITEHSAGTLELQSETPFEATAASEIAVTPDQAPVARLSASVPNSPATFDASGSTVEFGSIAEYAWDFGDGTTLVTSTPVVEHEYAQPGVYAASVRLTSSGGTSTEDVYTGQQLLRNGDASAVATVTVTVPEPGGLPELPPTGVDGVWLVAVAAGLLGAGLVMLVMTRRRARN